MNMQVLKRSRQRPKPGDIFVYRLPGMDFGFGRVIRTDASMGRTWNNLLLLYLYRAFSLVEDDIPVLDKKNLLFPPTLLFDAGPWGKGYFKTVGYRPLVAKDVFSVHCFLSKVKSCYVDEFGRKLPRKRNPCGLYAVGSYVTIDAQISMALGFETGESDEGAAPRVHKSWCRGVKSKDLPLPELLRRLLEELEDFGVNHAELYDTPVREIMNQTIYDGFVLEKNDFAMPVVFGMETRNANRELGDILAKYIVSARARAAKDGLTTAQQRLDAFEDVDVVTDEEQYFDSFFGCREVVPKDDAQCGGNTRS